MAPSVINLIWGPIESSAWYTIGLDHGSEASMVWCVKIGNECLIGHISYFLKIQGAEISITPNDAPQPHGENGKHAKDDAILQKILFQCEPSGCRENNPGGPQYQEEI